MTFIQQKIFLVCAVIAVFLGTAHSQCTRLPPEENIQNIILGIVISIGGEGAGSKVALLSHHFTCIAPTERMGEIRQLSVAVVYNVTSEMGVTVTRRGQVQLECLGTNNYQRGSSPLEQGPPAVAFNLTTREYCFLCDPDGPGAPFTIDTDANCVVCPNQCGELGGQNRCYGPPAVCCPVYENKVCAEMCSTNRTASAATNFTCECSDGFVEISATQCRSLCDPNPCQNGGNCTASGNSTMCSCPPQYTGANCESATPAPTTNEPVTTPVTTPIITTPTPRMCPANCRDCASPTCCTVCEERYEVRDCGCVVPPTCSLEGCVTCVNSTCCRMCDDGYRLVTDENGCRCELPTPPPPCRVPNCANCSNSLSNINRQCCVQCQPGHRLGANECTCDEQRATNDAAVAAGIAIGVLLALLILIALVVLVIYLIYAYVAHGMASKRAKPLAPFGNGDAHDNPLYIPPKELDDEEA